MGIGFIPEDDNAELIHPLPDDTDVPSSMFGLNPRQMLAMGIAGDDVQRLQQNVTEVRLLITSTVHSTHYLFSTTWFPTGYATMPETTLPHPEDCAGIYSFIFLLCPHTGEDPYVTDTADNDA